MGSPYKVLSTKFTELTCDPHSDIVVEIGSGVADGSTKYLSSWANAQGLPFYSIDINEQSQNALSGLDINFVIATGHVWCRDTLPTMNKKIKVLYLDNMDYLWEDTPGNLESWRSGVGIDVMHRWFEKQVQLYAAKNINLTRETSMEEHRLQVMYCLPFMSEQSIIIMDDTLDNQGQPYGKCATAIPLLLAAGYELSPEKYHYAYRQYNDKR